MQHSFRSVTVYADAQDNLFVIPNGESKRFFGALFELNLVRYLPAPHGDEELEQALTEAMALCFQEPNDEPGARGPMENFLGVKGYDRAVRGKRCMVFDWVMDEGYSVVATMRVRPKGYDHLTEQTIWLGQQWEPGQLAQAMRRAMALSTAEPPPPVKKRVR